MASKFFKENLKVIFLFVILTIAFYLIFLENITIHGSNNLSSTPIKPQGTLNKEVYLPSPAFSTGLAWDGHFLWVAENDHDKIYKMNPSTGDLLQQFTAPGNDPSGLTWINQNLWCSDWKKERIYKIDPSSGDIINSFESPGTQPTGLAWDGQYLWNADNAPGKIFKIDIFNGLLIDSFDSPEVGPKGLTWDGQHLLVSIPAEGKIYKIDPSNGMTVADFNDPVEDTHGITWDGHYLWETDHSNKKVYRVLIQDQVLPTWDENPSDQTVIDGESFSYDVNASDNVAIDHYWINDMQNFTIDSEGIITNKIKLSLGNYSLEIRAYDTSGNYISKTIKITVESNIIPGFELGIVIVILVISIVSHLINKRKRYQSKCEISKSSQLQK